MIAHLVEVDFKYTREHAIAEAAYFGLYLRIDRNAGTSVEIYFMIFDGSAR